MLGAGIVSGNSIASSSGNYCSCSCYRRNSRNYGNLKEMLFKWKHI